MERQWTVATHTSRSDAFRDKIKISSSTSPALGYKIATSQFELEQAFRLVHDAYAQEGYINPHPSGIRLSLINALPTSTTFIGLQGDQVVATLSLFPDSALGLPMDSIYKEEIDALRLQNRRIAEVGTLAAAPNCRSWDLNIPLFLNKTMLLYAIQYLQIDDFVITVNPKHQRFYTDILLFESMGETKVYESVNHHPAVLLRLDLKAAKEKCRRVYSAKPLSKNLYHFFFVKQHDCISLPKQQRPVNVWTEELMAYFFRQKTDLFKAANQETLNQIKLQHLSHYSSQLEQIFNLNQAE